MTQAAPATSSDSLRSERGAAWGNAGYGGYSGILINPWTMDLQWGPSDFDVRHQINVNWIANFPFGRNHRFGRDGHR